MTEVMVTMRHVRAMRMCARGARAFFARHGLDWSAFLQNGMPADQLIATGDALAIKVAEYARSNP